MTVLNIPLVKAGVTMAFDTDLIPEATFAEALLLGLKTLLNRGQEKFTKAQYPDAEELKAVSLAKGQEMFDKLMAGEFRASRTTSKSTIPGPVKTEAMRLARNLVKDAIKREGGKIYQYEARDITAAAKEMIEDPENGPAIIAEATANLERARGVKVPVSVGGLKPSQKKVAAAEKAKAEKAAKRAAEKGETLSAAEAGRPKAKAKAKPVMAGLNVMPKASPSTHATH
jgi:hypothetical protein